MLIENKVEDIICKPLAARGYDIVRIKFSSSTLQVLLERTDAKHLTVGECESASKLISIMLDTEDIIRDRYLLEVSSAGLDGPLVKLKDFEKYLGQSIKVSLSVMVDKKKKFKGKILSVSENLIFLEEEETKNIIKFHFEDVLSANLITKIDFKKK